MSVKSLRSGSTVVLWAFAAQGGGANEKSGVPIAYANNATQNRITNAEEIFGLGAFRPQGLLLHSMRFRMTFRQMLMFDKPLTAMGIIPVDSNWLSFLPPNIYVVDLVSGKTALAMYGMLVTNQTYNIAQQQTVGQNVSSIVMNMLDSFELGLDIPA